MKRNIALEWSAGKSFAFPSRLKKIFIRYTPAICSYLLASLFLYAAYNKLRIYNEFIIQLTNSPMTIKYANTLAWLVPSLEILIAVLLLIPRTRIAGLYSGFLLMFAFTVFIYRILVNRAFHSCGCGGIIDGFTWRQHLWFNMFFTFLPALAVYVKSFQKKDTPT